MVELGHGPGLRVEALDKGRLLGGLGREDLEGHDAVEGLLAGLVDHAHAALAQELEDLVAGNIADGLAELLRGRDPRAPDLPLATRAELGDARAALHAGAAHFLHLEDRAHVRVVKVALLDHDLAQALGLDAEALELRLDLQALTHRATGGKALPYRNLAEAIARALLHDHLGAGLALT